MQKSNNSRNIIFDKLLTLSFFEIIWIFDYLPKIWYAELLNYIQNGMLNNYWHKIRNNSPANYIYINTKIVHLIHSFHHSCWSLDICRKCNFRASITNEHIHTLYNPHSHICPTHMCACTSSPSIFIAAHISLSYNNM